MKNGGAKKRCHSIMIRGGTLDRMLLHPGPRTKADWFPKQGAQDEGREDANDDASYLALVLPMLAISEHFPAFLAPPWETVRQSKIGTKLILDVLAKEE